MLHSVVDDLGLLFSKVPFYGMLNMNGLFLLSIEILDISDA